MEDSHGSAVRSNKHCKPRPEPSRIHLEIYTERRQFTGALWNLWMASYSTGPAKSSRLRWKHVLKLWPLWTTAKQNIVGYCSHGNHKADLINDALTKGYTLEVRYKQAWDEPQARKLENDLLDMYDYAWNERRNGGKLGIRLLPNWYAVIQCTKI